VEDPAAVDVDDDVAAAVVLDDSAEVVDIVGVELPELVDGGAAVEVADCGVAVRATAEEAVVLVAMAVVGDDEQAPTLTPTSAASPATIKEPRNLEYRFMNRLLLNPRGLSTGPCTATIPDRTPSRSPATQAHPGSTAGSPSTDLRIYTPKDLLAAAAQLNSRPRKTLGWDPPGATSRYACELAIYLAASWHAKGRGFQTPVRVQGLRTRWQCRCKSGQRCRPPRRATGLPPATGVRHVPGRDGVPVQAPRADMVGLPDRGWPAHGRIRSMDVDVAYSTTADRADVHRLHRGCRPGRSG